MLRGGINASFNGYFSLLFILMITTLASCPSYVTPINYPVIASKLDALQL